jgi:hypothetical protein
VWPRSVPPATAAGAERAYLGSRIVGVRAVSEVGRVLAAWNADRGGVQYCGDGCGVPRA